MIPKQHTLLTNSTLFLFHILLLNLLIHNNHHQCLGLSPPLNNHNRRSFLEKSASTAAASGMLWLPSYTAAAAAEDATVVPAAAVPVEMKTFVDPKGLFALNVPKRYFTLRRTEKGDLPDEKTGKGRRGSSIFTAGDMTKAEIVAVERFPAVTLLMDQGIEVSSSEEKFERFSSIGSAQAVAELLYLKREREMQGKSRSKLVPDSVVLSADEKTIEFQLTTNIDVQKPELLMEQEGISELVRVILAKATLNSNDGNIMAVYASALQQDFVGPDGDALRNTISSFTVTNNNSESNTIS